MVNVIQWYFKNRFGIEPKKAGEDGFFLPVFGEINFDSTYDCLARFFSEIGCNAYEVSTNDRSGSDEFAIIMVKGASQAFRVVITANVERVLFQIT